jgi:hypothetical protein
MKKSLMEGWQGFLKLLRFLIGYGVFVAVVFYLLPIAGHLLEARYETLSSTTRFFSVIGFFAVVAGWHVMNTRDRWRAPA